MHSHSYVFCGWLVHSFLALPRLAEWRGEARMPDIRIGWGEPAPTGEWHPGRMPHVRFGADGECWLRVRRTGDFFLPDGHQVLIAPLADADPAKLADVVMQYCLVAILLQRGLSILHAACLDWGGEAVAFSGPHGMGKSTLAAALVGRGHRLLSDDICAIDPFHPDGPRAFPVFPEMMLYQDSLTAVVGEAAPARPGSNKHRHRPNNDMHFAPGGMKLRAICFLDWSPGEGRESMLPLSPATVHARLNGDLLYGPLQAQLQKNDRRQASVAQLAANVAVFEIRRPRNLADPVAILPCLQGQFGDGGDCAVGSASNFIPAQ